MHIILRDLGFLRADVADIGALLVQRALSAPGPLGVADLATMADQADVQAVDPVWWRYLRKHGMGLVGVHLRADQA